MKNMGLMYNYFITTQVLLVHWNMWMDLLCVIQSYWEISKKETQRSLKELRVLKKIAINLGVPASWLKSD